MKLSEIKEAIAERFFEKQLDDAYYLGIKQGSTATLSNVKMKVEYRKKKYTPARQEGMQVAIDVIEMLQDRWERNG